jgi:beta-ketoacyl synthase-like protein
MNAVAIAGVGLCAPGLADWAHARDLLTGPAPWADGAVPRLASAALPPTERRRANVASRWAIEAATDAVRDLAPAEVAQLASVFASADGDGEVLATVLRDVAQDKVQLSPTTFHNSVYNAPAGYWSLAAKAPAASTTVCAGDATLAAALIEAASQVVVSGAPVLLVAYDLPFPPGAPIGTRALTPFACALRLTPDTGAPACGRLASMAVVVGREADAPPQSCGTLDARFAGNAAAAALPLLAAIARGVAASVRLPWLDGDALEVRWTP